MGQNECWLVVCSSFTFSTTSEDKAMETVKKMIEVQGHDECTVHRVASSWVISRRASENEEGPWRLSKEHEVCTRMETTKVVHSFHDEHASAATAAGYSEEI